MSVFCIPLKFLLINQIDCIVVNTRYVFQERQEDGADSATRYGRSSSGTDKDAQLPAVGVQPSASQFLQVQHIDCTFSARVPFDRELNKTVVLSHSISSI